MHYFTIYKGSPKLMADPHLWEYSVLANPFDAPLRLNWRPVTYLGSSKHQRENPGAKIIGYRYRRTD